MASVYCVMAEVSRNREMIAFQKLTSQLLNFCLRLDSFYDTFQTILNLLLCQHFLKHPFINVTNIYCKLKPRDMLYPAEYGWINRTTESWITWSNV